MYLEYPISEPFVEPFLHRYVGVVTLEGERHFGVLTACRDGKLELNGGAAEEASAPIRRKRRSRKASASRKRPRKARTSHEEGGPIGERADEAAWGPFPAYGDDLRSPFPAQGDAPCVVLELRSIAVLFVPMP